MNRIIVRTKQNVSFVGEFVNNDCDNGILLKPSSKSGITIWIPSDEVKQVIYPDGTVREGGGRQNASLG